MKDYVRQLDAFVLGIVMSFKRYVCSLQSGFTSMRDKRHLKCFMLNWCVRVLETSGRLTAAITTQVLKNIHLAEEGFISNVDHHEEVKFIKVRN